MLRSFDAVRYRDDGKLADSETVLERWINYLPSVGANWQGIIGAFNRTIDACADDLMVSTCMHGLVDLGGPATYNVTRKNYEPDRDLHLLFVQVVPLEGPN